MKVGKCFRQGEVLLLKLEDIPEGVELGQIAGVGKKLDHTILAEGEETGHMHEVVADKSGGVATLVDIGMTNPSRATTSRLVRLTPHGANSVEGVDYVKLPAGAMLLTVKGGTTLLEHPEHKPIRLGEGQYVVRIQREYDPEKNRRVVD